ncbi:hypothetical protein BN871_LG_00020 [Paenibacillus sp. P22]|nr:hypothetical protein BN871_LG_00020 [Paenibacillus sp. P22]
MHEGRSRPFGNGILERLKHRRHPGTRPFLRLSAENGLFAVPVSPNLRHKRRKSPPGQADRKRSERFPGHAAREARQISL